MLVSPEILFCTKATTSKLPCIESRKRLGKLFSLLGCSYVFVHSPLIEIKFIFLLPRPFFFIRLHTASNLYLIRFFLNFVLQRFLTQCPRVTDRLMGRCLQNGTTLQQKIDSSITLYQPLTKMLTAFPFIMTTCNKPKQYLN